MKYLLPALFLMACAEHGQISILDEVESPPVNTPTAPSPQGEDTDPEVVDTFEAEEDAEPSLWISEDRLRWDDVPMEGETEPKVLTLTNDGYAPIAVDIQMFSSDFSLSFEGEVWERGGPVLMVYLDVGAVVSLDVSVTPAATWGDVVVSDRLKISVREGATEHIALTGYACDCD